MAPRVTGGPVQPSALGTKSRGSMKASVLSAKAALKRHLPESSWGLGVAKVIDIDYEELFVTLRVVMGTSDVFDHIPVPMTFPGAGSRQFFGSLPMIGDHCVVGWATQESSTPYGTRRPVILAWLVPGVWPGREWITTGEFGVHEMDMEAPKDRKMFEGTWDQIRHKLRHIQPGNIVGSSAQGSDLVLDESVMLSNRRGNEFRLRDQDQAAITRALQRFDALAGTRVYAGMVQRDSAFLTPSMISDGNLWDAKVQSLAGVPLTDDDLVEDPTAPPDFLTPARNLRKNSLSASEAGRSVLAPDTYLDPYSFLRRGGYINEAGFATGAGISDAIYGGKPIYRVAQQSRKNATLDADTPTLTEYRIEMTHTADGRLPVTEQTDLFDAERLPNRDPNTPPGTGTPPNMPFIEWVMGSVVGNDPYTQAGRLKYGLPIVPVVFDGNKPAPRLDAATIAPNGSTLPSTPLGDQAAYLFHLSPPTAVAGLETFWAVNKKGQLRAALGGNPKENSVEAYLNGGLKLGIGGSFQLLLDSHLELGTRGKSSLNLSAQEGPVKIYGGASLKDESATVERMSGTGRGDADLPSVDIEGQTNVWVKADKQVLVKGNEVFLNASTVGITGHEQITIDGVKNINESTENLTLSVTGKCQETYSGPKYMLPTFMPIHERTYAPLEPGLICENVLYVAGDRIETFLLGNHLTDILIGNYTTVVGVGNWSATAVSSALTMGAPGINGVAAAGFISLTATAGAVAMTGTAQASLVATAGLAIVSGTAGVNLIAPITGPDFGPILTAGSLEPFTNLPFLTWGLGAKAHNVV